MSKRVAFTPGKMSKGGHNPNNESDARPEPPKGSGGRGAASQRGGERKKANAEVQRRHRDQQRTDFLQALAEYLSGPLSIEHSIALELERPHALLWAKIRHSTPVFGYQTVEETRAVLAEFLGLQLVYTETDA